MNEQRLAEIEAEHDGCEGYVDTMELVAEVRRLRRLVHSSYIEGYGEGFGVSRPDLFNPEDGWEGSWVQHERDNPDEA